jgi:transposase
MTDMKLAENMKLVVKSPHYNSIINYLQRPEMTAILKQLIEKSSLPLKAIETDFAIDSTGFSTKMYKRWLEHKYGSGKKVCRIWLKCSIMCGVKSKIVTSVEITDDYANDSPMLEVLVNNTYKNFNVKEVSADKAYSSRKNMEIINNIGAIPFIPFRNWSHSDNKGTVWDKMYHYFSLNRQEFERHYHKRSNVETAFYMIKTKFGSYVRSKKTQSQVNEVLCKILCHNICVLIKEMHELEISAHFEISNHLGNSF